MDIGTKLKQYRKQAKMTQQQLSKASGISRTYLSDVENNRYKPSVDFLKKVSDTLSDKLSLKYDEKNKLFSTLMDSTGYSLEDDELTEVCSRIQKQVINDILKIAGKDMKSFYLLTTSGVGNDFFEKGLKQVEDESLAVSDTDEIYNIYYSLLLDGIISASFTDKETYKHTINDLYNLKLYLYAHYHRPLSKDDIYTHVPREDMNISFYTEMDAILNDAFNKIVSIAHEKGIQEDVE